MTGIKMARIRLCARCEFNRNTGAWPWPRCCYVPDQRTGDGAPSRDNAFMEGADENCSAGYWAGLEPVDMEAERAKSKERMQAGVKDRALRHFKALKRDQGQDTALYALLTMVSLSGLPEWLALEIADEVGLGKA